MRNLTVVTMYRAKTYAENKTDAVPFSQILRLHRVTAYPHATGYKSFLTDVAIFL
jgi:hypothetical protein